MADKIYVYDLAKPGELTALKEVLKSLAYAWLGAGSSAEVSTEGFITMQGRDVSGNLPANEASARRAGEEALKKLLEYAGRLKDRPKALLRAVFMGVRYVSARPPADAGGVWRLLYWPYVRARSGEEAFPLAEERAYVAIEVGGGGRVVSLQVHLRPVVRQRLVAASVVKAPEVLVPLPGSDVFRVVYRVDWERSLYAPYYVSVAAGAAFVQGKGVGKAATLLVPAVAESKVPEPQKKEGCFCNRNFTEDELRNIIISIRKGTIMNESSGATVYDESKDRIFYLNKEEKVHNNSMAHFTEVLNTALAAYGIDRCPTKIHFLAQAYHESLGFRSTYEGNPRSTVEDCNKVPDTYYRGRGLIQLTHCRNYRDFFDSIKQELKDLNEEYKEENADIPEGKLKELVPLVAKELYYACLSSGWYWLKSGANRYALMDDASKVSAAINYPLALREPGKISGIYGLSERIRLTAVLKKAMDYENCKNK